MKANLVKREKQYFEIDYLHKVVNDIRKMTLQITRKTWRNGNVSRENVKKIQKNKWRTEVDDVECQDRSCLQSWRMKIRLVSRYVESKKMKMIGIIRSTRSLGCLRLFLKIVSRCKSVTVSKDADDLFNLMILCRSIDQLSFKSTTQHDGDK